MQVSLWRRCDRHRLLSRFERNRVAMTSKGTFSRIVWPSTDHDHGGSGYIEALYSSMVRPLALKLMVDPRSTIPRKQRSADYALARSLAPLVPTTTVATLISEGRQEPAPNVRRGQRSMYYQRRDCISRGRVGRCPLGAWVVSKSVRRDSDQRAHPPVRWQSPQEPQSKQTLQRP